MADRRLEIRSAWAHDAAFLTAARKKWPKLVKRAMHIGLIYGDKYRHRQQARTRLKTLHDGFLAAGVHG